MRSHTSAARRRLKLTASERAPALAHICAAGHAVHPTASSPATTEAIAWGTDTYAHGRHMQSKQRGEREGKAAGNDIVRGPRLPRWTAIPTARSPKQPTKTRRRQNRRSTRRQAPRAPWRRLSRPADKGAARNAGRPREATIRRSLPPRSPAHAKSSSEVRSLKASPTLRLRPLQDFDKTETSLDNLRRRRQGSSEVHRRSLQPTPRRRLHSTLGLLSARLKMGCLSTAARTGNARYSIFVD